MLFEEPVPEASDEEEKKVEGPDKKKGQKKRYPRSCLYNPKVFTPPQKGQTVYNMHCPRRPLTDLGPYAFHEEFPEDRRQPDPFSSGFDLGINNATGYRYASDPANQLPWAHSRLDIGEVPSFRDLSYPPVNQADWFDSQPGTRLAARESTLSTFGFQQSQLRGRFNQDLSAMLNKHFENVPEEEIPEELPADVVDSLLPDLVGYEKQLLKRRLDDQRPTPLSRGMPFFDSTTKYDNIIADEMQRREATSRGMLNKRVPEKEAFVEKVAPEKIAPEKRAPEKRAQSGSERMEKMRKKELLEMTEGQKDEKKRAEAAKKKLSRAHKKKQLEGSIEP